MPRPTAPHNGISSDSYYSQTGDSSIPLDSAGNPDLSQPADIRNYQTSLYREIEPAPPDAPGHPDAATIVAHHSWEFRGNYLSQKISLLLSSPGGNVQEEDSFSGMTSPNFGWLSYASNEHSLDYRFSDYSCGISATPTYEASAKWSIPFTGGVLDWGERKKLHSESLSWPCSGGQVVNGSSGSNNTTYLTVCHGYHVFDADGNYLYSEITSCTTYTYQS